MEEKRKREARAIEKHRKDPKKNSGQLMLVQERPSKCSGY